MLYRDKASARLLAQAMSTGVMCAALLSACTVANSPWSTRQQVFESSGLLLPGEQQTEMLPIGDILVATITVLSNKPDLVTSIWDSQGHWVASASMSAEPLEELPSFEATYSARMKLSAPADGTWQIRMSAESETRYVVVVEAETSTVLDVRTDRPRYFTGVPINVTAKLLSGPTLLRGGAMRGELRQGAESIQVVDLHETDDSIFKAQFAPVSEAMRPDLVVTATHETIQRQVKVPLVIVEPTARILGVRSEQLLDSDNDEKTDQLVIDVQLDVRQAGRYSLAAHLESREGAPIAYAEHNTAIEAALGQGSDTLRPGEPIITLTFPGGEIQDHGIDGPYSLRLTLYDIDQAGTELDTLEYITRTYVANDFR